jgi:hypothetical protein
MLRPIMEQDEAMAQYYRTHRPVQDVDPETGELDNDTPVIADPTVTEGTNA